MLKEGTRIYYRGDMANFEDFGTIKRAYTDRWGSFYDIDLDDGRKIEALYSLMVDTVDSGNGSTRFVTLDAYKAHRLSQTPKESPFYGCVVEQMDAIS